MPHTSRFAPAGTLRSRAYRLLWAGARRFPRSAPVCLHVAAGLLREEDLEASACVQWSAFTTAVDDVDEGLLPWEERLYADVLRPSDRVLVVGCGAGRDLVALHERGHEVTGVDLSREITDVARGQLTRRGIAAAILTGRIEKVDLGGRYDVIIFSQGCFGCIPRSRTRIETLARLARYMPRDGRLVLTYSGRERASPAGLILTRLSGFVSRSNRHSEAGDGFSEEHLATNVLRFEHHFNPEEVVRECVAAGFRVVSDGLVATSFRYAVAVPSESAS